MIGAHFDRWGSVYAVQPLIGIGLLVTDPGIPILMYHSVADDNVVGGAPYYRTTTSPARFREQMQCLHDWQFDVIGLPEAHSRLERGLEKSRRSVVLTFDDGFEDFLKNAWPILEMFNFPATMFLPTAFIGPPRQAFRGRDCLTWSEVRTLHRSGISFGAHTVHHPVLYKMPWAQIRRELRDSRDMIENQLQTPIDSFAYPYGFPQEDRRFVDRYSREVAEAGYRRAVTTVVGRARSNENFLTLKRLPVSENDDESLFRSKLSGGYDWMGPLQLLVRRCKNPLAWTSRSSS